MKRLLVVSLVCASVCTGVPTVGAVEPARETILHSFGAGTDGKAPYASLIDVNATLYGTTAFGGADGSGTVFALDPVTGAESVLYSFPAGNPTSGLASVKGILYGTTYTGGSYGNGMLYSFDPTTDVFAVIHSFGNNDDGSNPYSAPIYANGTLYGTTEYGGAHGAGAVFAFRLKTGTESILYSFCRKQRRCADGAYPYAGVIDVKGTLYGTTQFGGPAGCEQSGCGTVYSLDPGTGVEKVLYAFCSQKKCADGEEPGASLIAVNGTLYGTTLDGGKGINGYGYGTVFALDATTGTESVLYSFCSQQNCADGVAPQGGLLAINGTLYGTTVAGGAYGNGVAFSLVEATQGETVLHSFGSSGDGLNPQVTLVDVKGTLFGTTSGGGSDGGGTVFMLRKP
jgi:uncharacterized repeat protein (TIGR03803 family)